MFNTKTAKGEETQTRVLDAALELFRRKGFDSATMRDIAGAAGLSLGAAYHYFPGKEALVHAYYQRVQDEHRRRVREVLAGEARLKDRLAAVIHLKLDILGEDRKLLGALFRYTGDPGHPLSFLGSGTAEVRKASVEVFEEALAEEDLPADLRTLMPLLLWAMHMGILLYFLYDDSPNQQRTRRLTDTGLALVLSILKLARFPMLRPIRKKVLAMLMEAKLV